MKDTILIFGGSGKLGSKMSREFSASFNVVSPTSRECDITSTKQLRHIILKNRPSIIVNSAALVGAKECELNQNLAWKINVDGANNIANICIEFGIRLIYISSAAIFNGNQGLYRETDSPSPTFYYAITKVAAEQSAKMVPEHVIIRVDFFVPEHEPKYRDIFIDHYTSKCTSNQAVESIGRIIKSNYKGIINIGNERDSLYNIYSRYFHSIRPIKINESQLPEYPKDISLNLDVWKHEFQLGNV